MQLGTCVSLFMVMSGFAVQLTSGKRYICYHKDGDKSDGDTQGDCSRDCTPCEDDIKTFTGHTCLDCGFCGDNPAKDRNNKMVNCYRPDKIPDQLEEYREAGDPHFIIKSPTSDDRLCFDYHGAEGEVITLIDDPASDISIEGQLHKWAADVKHASVFSKIIVTSDTTELVFGYDDVQVDGESLSWSIPSPVQIGDFHLSQGDRPDTIDVHNLKNDVTLAVRLRQGALLGKHISVIVTNKGKLHYATSGMLGQFFFAELQLHPSPHEGTEQRMLVTFPDQKPKLIPVTPAVMDGQPCWHYAPHQGDLLVGNELAVRDAYFEGSVRKGDTLLGQYEQYIVEYGEGEE